MERSVGLKVSTNRFALACCSRDGHQRLSSKTNRPEGNWRGPQVRRSRKNCFALAWRSRDRRICSRWSAGAATGINAFLTSRKANRSGVGWKGPWVRRSRQTVSGWPAAAATGANAFLTSRKMSRSRNSLAAARGTHFALARETPSGRPAEPQGSNFQKVPRVGSARGPEGLDKFARVCLLQPRLAPTHF